MRVSAERELLAAREDVWKFLAEPYHLSDWWPGISAVRPDRRGFTAGARWQVVGTAEPSLLRRSRATETAVVRHVEPPERAAWHLTGQRLDVEVRLEWTAPDRTMATVAVDGPWLLGSRRTIARRAVNRLHELCQTAASL